MAPYIYKIINIATVHHFIENYATSVNESCAVYTVVYKYRLCKHIGTLYNMYGVCLCTGLSGHALSEERVAPHIYKASRHMHHTGLETVYKYNCK